MEPTKIKTVELEIEVSGSVLTEYSGKIVRSVPVSVLTDGTLDDWVTNNVPASELAQELKSTDSAFDFDLIEVAE